MTDPSASSPSAYTSTRSLPVASPRRPASGVKMDAETRYAVTTHVTVVGSVPSSSWMRGRTGIVSDWTSANDATPTQRTASVTR